MQADALREARPEMQENTIQMQQENTEKFFYASFPIILIFNLLIGLVVGLVTGIFTKKS